MFGQLASDEAFAFFIYYSIFPLYSPVLPYGFLVLRKIYYRFFCSFLFLAYFCIII